jgi:hypothetical protein
VEISNEPAFSALGVTAERDGWAEFIVAVGDIHTAESFPDSVPGGPPPPLKNGNRRGYLQVSASDGLRRRPGAMRISLPPD